MCSCMPPEGVGDEVDTEASLKAPLAAAVVAGGSCVAALPDPGVEGPEAAEPPLCLPPEAGAEMEGPEPAKTTYHFLCNSIWPFTGTNSTAKVFVQKDRKWLLAEERVSCILEMTGLVACCRISLQAGWLTALLFSRAKMDKFEQPYPSSNDLGGRRCRGLRDAPPTRLQKVMPSLPSSDVHKASTVALSG